MRNQLILGEFSSSLDRMLIHCRLIQIVSQVKRNRADVGDSIGDRNGFCCQNPSPKSMKLRPHEDFSYLVTNLTTFLTTNRIIISSDDNEDTKCKKDRFINRKTVWENTVVPESLIG